MTCRIVDSTTGATVDTAPTLLAAQKRLTFLARRTLQPLHVTTRP